MIAVIYNPATGVITHTLQAPDAATMAKNGSYVEVSEWRPDYDALYLVVDGKVVLKSTVPAPAPVAPSAAAVQGVQPTTAATGATTTATDTPATPAS